jgi:hypothetical protein
MRSRVTAWTVSVVSGAVLGGAIVGAPHVRGLRRECVIRNSTRLLSDPPSAPLEACPGVWWVYVLVGVGLAGVITGSALDRQ